MPCEGGFPHPKVEISSVHAGDLRSEDVEEVRELVEVPDVERLIK